MSQIYIPLIIAHTKLQFVYIQRGPYTTFINTLAVSHKPIYKQIGADTRLVQSQCA